MNERSKSDLLFEEDEEFIDALEEAVEYIKDNIKCESLNKVLSLASTNEIIDLYETGFHGPDNCDFFDAYDILENKYL